MLIFKDTHTNLMYIYIHIPKNSGKYIRKQIEDNSNNKIIHSFWGINNNNMDLAHIPYTKRFAFIDKKIKYNYFAHSRNPYDRIISAFFYLNKTQTISGFQNFIKNTLITYKFDLEFDKTHIHYYPQYLFICDKQFNITNHIKIYKLEYCENPTTYDLNEYFDDKCIEIINNIYKKDFLLFDYEIILINKLKT